jgi:hypothetical protein
MILASFESLLGSIWFAGLTLVVGYIAAHVVPITTLSDLFKKDGK